MFTKRLQPTAAVLGLPRSLRALFIRQHEPLNAVGMLALRAICLCLMPNLRLACVAVNLHDDALTLYAGAGWLVGSDPFFARGLKLKIKQQVCAFY